MSRLLILGGIAGPLLFTTVVVICAMLRPDYSHLAQFISALGATGTPNAALMNYAGFMASGALIFSCGLGLAGKFPGGALAVAASLLVAGFGAGMFLAGVYSCDPGCLPVEPSREQVLHDVVSLAAFLSMIVGVAVWGLRLRRVSEWSGFAKYSFLTAGVAALILIAMIAVPAVVPVIGLIQRVFLATLFMWLVLLALRGIRSGNG